MTEPVTTSAATGIAALLGGLTLDLLGLPYLAVVWGFVGAMVAMMQLNTVATMSTLGAFAFGLLSTLVGGALGTFGVEFLGLQGRAALIVGSLVGGAGAFGLVNALLSLATTYTRGKAAQHGPPDPGPMHGADRATAHGAPLAPAQEPKP